MTAEVAPDIFRLPIPITGSPLGSVNSYAIRGDNGWMLVDCGWDTPDAYEALVSGLKEAGGSVPEVREIIVTHIHPDHYGLAGRLVEESGARESMHRLEAAYVLARYEETTSLIGEMEAWLRINGTPPAELDAMTGGSLRMVSRVGTRRPDVVLEGAESISWGRYTFDVIWTPGHSSGLVVLHDPREQVMLSSDHVLERISPHVGMHVQSFGNPLDDYITALRSVRDLPVTVVLPGHGAPFTNLAERVDELIEHHEQRFQTMLGILGEGDGSAFDVASQMTWRRIKNGWSQLEPFQRRMALTETIAHLEYMAGRGMLHKSIKGGIVTYRPLLS